MKDNTISQLPLIEANQEAVILGLPRSIDGLDFSYNYDREQERLEVNLYTPDEVVASYQFHVPADTELGHNFASNNPSLGIISTIDSAK